MFGKWLGQLQTTPIKSGFSLGKCSLKRYGSYCYEDICINKNLQDQWWWWFSYICLILGYLMFITIWTLNIVTVDYKDDRTFVTLYTVLVFTSLYNVIASMSLGLIIMFIVMILMIISLILWFPWIIFCQEWMSWRPRNDGDIDRNAFDNMINQRTNVQDVLLYIFK